MTEILMNEAELLHSMLCEETNKNIGRIQEIQNFSNSLSSLLTSFKSLLHQANKSMFKKLKQDQQQDSAIIFLSKFAVDLLGELGKKIDFVVKKVKNQVSDPLEQFCESQKNSYQQLRDKSGELFMELQSNSSFLMEINRNQNSQRSQSLTEREIEDFKQIFQIQTQKCNQKFMEIKQSYKKLLSQADSTNSFRCNFTLKMQVKLCKLLNKLVNSPNVDESLMGYEQICDETERLSIMLKEKIRDNLGKSLLLEQKSNDQFDSLDQFAYTEKLMIDEFILLFTGFSNFKEEQSKYEKARTLILSNIHWSSYFLSKLANNLHTEIKLSSNKYHQITTILKYMFASVAQQQNNQQILYKLLYVSYRMSYNGNYIIRELGKYQSYWQNQKIWDNIILHLHNQKSPNHKKKQMPQNGRIRQAVKIGITWIVQQQQNNQWLERRNKNDKIVNDAKAYEILCEVNYFMSRMEIDQKFVFEFVVHAAEKYKLSKENLQKLLKLHYFNKQNSNSKTNPNYLKRKKNLEEKFRNLTKQEIICTCVGKCLPFLQANQNLLQLRLVCKLWSAKLFPKIGKRFLIEQRDEQFMNKIRLKVYNAYCPNILTEKVFNKMITQLPESTEHSDIIVLDAKRSLAWDESLRENLIIVLKCFAFYHPNVGYLQGMNYLCQNLLKLTDQKFSIYKIFEYLMNNPFHGMYSANFDGLKTKLYVFTRLLQRQKPKLYTHFETQKLEGEHFVLPWAITLWGEMSGDLCWVLWDGFISKGWKWWFKTLIWLLGVLEPELIQMNFEQMMKCFSDLSVGLLNMNSKDLKDFGIDIYKAKKQIDNIQIHDDLIKDLEKQYKVRVQMVNQYLKKLNKVNGKKSF